MLNEYFIVYVVHTEYVNGDVLEKRNYICKGGYTENCNSATLFDTEEDVYNAVKESDKQFFIQKVYGRKRNGNTAKAPGILA